MFFSAIRKIQNNTIQRNSTRYNTVQHNTTQHLQYNPFLSILLGKITALEVAMMSPEEKRNYRLKKTIEEIVQTEREYINDLDVIIRVCSINKHKQTNNLF